MVRWSRDEARRSSSACEQAQPALTTCQRPGRPAAQRRACCTWRTSEGPHVIASIQARAPQQVKRRSPAWMYVDLHQNAHHGRMVISHSPTTDGRQPMIRWTALVLGLAMASSVQAMPYAPLQQTDGMTIPVRQGCGLGRQLLDGVCVRNSAVRKLVRNCNAKNMRLVNGRCEPHARRPAQPAKPAPAT